MHTIECHGAPRDLGLDQGAACAPAVREWLDAQGIARRRWLPSLRRLTSGAALGSGVGREVIRHYPHLAERMAGIARASSVALDALMEDVVGSVYGAAGNALATPAVAVAGGAPDSDAEPQLARTLDGSLPWALRRSAPEVGFDSVEVTLPWLAGALVGVNESGLGSAVAVPEASPRHAGVGAAPAWLLVQECLQRFDDIDAAIEWCLKRPAAGDFGILLGDASGDRALIEFGTAGAEGEAARLVQRGGGSAVHGGSPTAREAARKQLERGVADALDGPRALVSLGERRVAARDASGEESMSLS